MRSSADARPPRAEASTFELLFLKPSIGYTLAPPVITSFSGAMARTRGPQDWGLPPKAKITFPRGCLFSSRQHHAKQRFRPAIPLVVAARTGKRTTYVTPTLMGRVDYATEFVLPRRQGKARGVSYGRANGLSPQSTERSVLRSRLTPSQSI